MSRLEHNQNDFSECREELGRFRRFRPNSYDNQLKVIIDSGRLKEVDKREDHCAKCTQCSYWLHKAKTYLRKVDRHMFQA